MKKLFRLFYNEDSANLNLYVQHSILKDNINTITFPITLQLSPRFTASYVMKFIPLSDHSVQFHQKSYLHFGPIPAFAFLLAYAV